MYREHDDNQKRFAPSNVLRKLVTFYLGYLFALGWKASVIHCSVTFLGRRALLVFSSGFLSRQP